MRLKREPLGHDARRPIEDHTRGMMYAHRREPKTRLSEAFLSPFRAGFVYGVVAVLVALISDLHFLFIDPEGIPDWILTVIEGFRNQIALAAYLFLAILAALRVRPTRVEEGVPYRALLLRDCALAATVVAVMVGATLFVVTALNATLLAEDIRSYAHDAAPSIVAYDEKVAGRLDNPPPLPTVEQVEEDLQPPVLRDLGRSMAYLVLRTLLLGTAGAIVGALRGSFGLGRDAERLAPPEQKESASGKSLQE